MHYKIHIVGSCGNVLCGTRVRYEEGSFFLAFGVEFSLSVCQLAFITYTDTHLLAAVISTNTALQNDSNYTAETNQLVRYNTVNLNRTQTTG
jgi:hypothetical protein